MSDNVALRPLKKQISGKQLQIRDINNTTVDSFFSGIDNATTTLQQQK